MPDPIRVLHFADVHVGVETYGRTDPETGINRRVLDYLHRMDEMIALTRERGVDLIIFAGDAFRTRTPNPTYQREFAYRILDLSQMAPVVLLVGNHDIPSTSLKASSIEIYDTLRVPNVWVADKYEGRIVETARGPVYVAAAPFPVRQRLLESAGGPSRSIREADDKLALTMGHLLDELAAEADKHDMPRLLTGHFTVGGAVVGSERSMMMGRDLDVNLGDLADDRWDYVALGHIHKHQNLTKGRTDVPPVVYSGSIERVDFGEESDPKGVCFVEMSRGGTQWAFTRLDARPFSTLRVDVRESDDPTSEAIALIERSKLRDSIARLFVQIRQEQVELFNEARVREALRGAGVFHIAVIRKDIETPQRSRLGISPEGLTPSQLLERYLVSADVPAARREALLVEALSLMNGE